MKKHQGSRGSALLLAVIVVLLAAGVGGSFLVVNLSNAKSQKTITDQDELMSMCDAGMERAKQALDIYRGYTPPGYTAPAGAKSWAWNDILVYCSNNYTAKPVPFDYTEPIDTKFVVEDAIRAMTDPSHAQYKQFQNYSGSVSWQASGTLWGKNTVQAALTVPANPKAPTSGDPAAGTFIGWNIPFHKGAVHVYVHNNGGTLLDDSGKPILGADGLPQVDTATEDKDRMICITVTATLLSGAKSYQGKGGTGAIFRQVEGMYRLPPPPPPASGPQLAAVTSQDDIETLGNVTIDGRDWNEDGTSIVGPGVFGLLSTKNITVGGSSTIAGSGNPPPKKGAAPGSTMSNGGSYFPDGYPDSPDAVMKLPKGELKKAAMAAGTYFAKESDYLKALPPTGFSGAIVYCEFDPSPSFQIGGKDTYNDKPTIFVVHNDTGTTSVKNTKGFLKGLLIADEVNHTSAPGGLIGAEFLLSPTAASGANAFGTANTPIKFSSQVINNLPSPNNQNITPSNLVSYRKVQ